MWFITKLLDTNANHNNYIGKGVDVVGCDLSRNYLIRMQITTLRWQNVVSFRDVIYHEITWYECKSQRSTPTTIRWPGCDLSRNYLIRMQITTCRQWYRQSHKMWFITKLLDTNANHNFVYVLIRSSQMWFITKLLDTNANHNVVRFVTSNDLDVIYHEITWYECKSQQCHRLSSSLHRCDLSRNYLIRMQITTISTYLRAFWSMWFITKLLDTNANHNLKN